MSIRSTGWAVLASVALAACSNGDEGGTALVRVGNLSPDAGFVDLYVGGALLAGDVEYFDGTGYVEVPSGTQSFVVTVAGDEGAVLLADDVDLANEGSYTLLAGDFVDDMTAIFFLDVNSAPSAGQFQVRVMHAAPSQGPVDAYLTTPGASLDGRDPDVAGLGFNRASVYLEAPAGSYQLRLTPAGSKTVALDMGTIAFGAGQIGTLLVGDQEGGGTPIEGLMLADLE